MALVLITTMLLCLSLGANSASEGVVEIIAHRGASYYAPENTLASVKLAWEMNADGVEIDIHRSKDGRIVVIHDATTGRTADVDLVVSESDSSRIRAVDVGSFKGKEFAGEKIPYLEEVLAGVPPGRMLFVEIKCGKEVLPLLRKAILDSRKKRQVRVIGFDLDTIAAFKQIMPDVPVYWLYRKTRDDSYSLSLIEDAMKHKIDGLNLYNIGLDKRYVDSVKAAGLKIYAWTVNDPPEAKRLADIGVDGITTDRPDVLLSIVRGK